MMEEFAFPLLVAGALAFGGVLNLYARWQSDRFDREFHIDGK
jgi:hypothetical protein